MRRIGLVLHIAANLVFAGLGLAAAQEVGSLHPQPLPKLDNPEDSSTPAKQLFGRVTTPIPTAAKAIGFYSRGCLAGALALPVDGQTWQVMRVSRNRNWGHPNLIAFLERFSARV